MFHLFKNFIFSLFVILQIIHLKTHYTQMSWAYRGMSESFLMFFLNCHKFFCSIFLIELPTMFFYDIGQL